MLNMVGKKKLVTFGFSFTMDRTIRKRHPYMYKNACESVSRVLHPAVN